jgi:hypothetical protein
MTIDITPAEYELIVDSLRYSERAVGDEGDTPVDVRKAKTQRLQELRHKLSLARDK